MSNTAISFEVKVVAGLSKSHLIGTSVKEFSGSSILTESNFSSSIEEKEILSELSEQTDGDVDETEEQEHLLCVETFGGTGGANGGNEEDED